ncbi:DUF1449 domain-containing protein [Spiractinospora alimapuensis]|uniref:DUF1449 domain-containing protein n=1 Tax=Spiractinospora alimapuensis TaxID=2820884 RepID=UPI001F2D1B06|nr:DUF1449 domain-containing protein [Spiractinospora alimapuensis]QVQ50477.1 DUF1449 domain-containing protein [Spiractinospora alimapuensis]
MGEFLDAALGFPTVLFSFALVVVLAYWLLALLGVLDLGLLDSSDDGDGPGMGAMLSAIGLGGMPATLSLSLLVLLAWFCSLVGNVVIDSLTGLSTPIVVLLGLLVLVIAVTIAWGLTSGVAVGIRRLFPTRRSPEQQREGTQAMGASARSAGELVGRTCTVRTLRVDQEFGQAEVLSKDGSTMLIQVRTIDDDALTSGDTALIFDHDTKTGLYRVARFDALSAGEP